jgi:hypothetical protein
MSTSVGSGGTDEPTESDDNSSWVSLHETAPTHWTYGANNNSTRTLDMMDTMSTSAGSGGADEPTEADDNKIVVSFHKTVPTQRTSRGDNNNNRTHGMDSTETLEREGIGDSVDRNVIPVGTFKINGEIKHFAVVPSLLIRSQLTYKI